MEGELGHALYAGGLGALSASALVLGAVLGIYGRPTQKVVAAVMAFGAGALIAALALELASEANEKGGFVALAIGFVAGGIIYWSLNALVESKGGFLRKRSTRRRHLMWRKEQAAAAAEQAAPPPVDRRTALAHLPKTVAQTLGGHAQVHHYRAGEEIFKAGDKGDTLFVIDRGRVRLTGGEDTAAELAIDGTLSQAWREVFGGVGGANDANGANGSSGATAPAAPEGEASELSEVAAAAATGEAAAAATAQLERLSRRFGPGETFGEMALLSGTVRVCSAVAETDVDVLRIDQKGLQLIAEKSPRLALAISRVLAQRLGLAGVHEAQLEAEVAHWREGEPADHTVVTAAEERALHEAHKENSGAPLAIFMGALIDGIPESVVIGAELVASAAFNPTFVVAVFISNLPEAMSSAAGMKQAGYSTRRIMGMWTGLTVASAIAAFLGNLLLAESNPTVVAVVDAIAGGGILAMLASTMMPEAFEQGGPSVSFSTIAGFLAAFFFHALGTG